MIIKPFEDELSLIIEALCKYPEETITGALLGTLIRNTASSLNIREVVEMPFGTGALTKFINLYLSNYLFLSGNKGGDVVYTILCRNVPASPTVSTTPPNIWAVFISPLNQYSIYLDRAELSLSVSSSDKDSQIGNLNKIESLTPSELQSIQTEFMAMISKGREEHPLIAKLLSASNNAEWFNILKISHTPEYKQWLTFRRQRIETLFAERLRQLSLAEEDVLKLAGALMTTQFQASKAFNKTNAVKLTPKVSAPSLAQTEEQQFRQGIIAAISEMSIEDLRQLSLPYGAVFDSLIKLRR